MEEGMRCTLKATYSQYFTCKPLADAMDFDKIGQMVSSDHVYYILLLEKVRNISLMERSISV